MNKEQALEEARERFRSAVALRLEHKRKNQMGRLMGESDLMEARGLKVIKVSKVKLLEAIQQCREAHKKAFAEAHTGWKKRVVSELGIGWSLAKEDKKFTTYFELPEPQDHTKDYDRVIMMLQMSIDTEIDLPAAEFARYVMDEWEWKQAFEKAHIAYSAVF